MATSGNEIGVEIFCGSVENEQFPVLEVILQQWSFLDDNDKLI